MRQAGRVATLGFLHTAQVHVDTFDALVRAVSSATTVHAVLPDLLERARASGPGPALSAAVHDALDDLVSQGAEVVVCTCSTLGPIAEEVQVAVPIVRVDRPMARRAVRAGSRIGVIAALSSTLRPTAELLADEAARADREVHLVEVCAPDAWSAFERGDSGAYAEQIADAARSVAPSVDVVVLAQASMAGAVSLLGDLPVPVLTSPQPAVEAAIEVAAQLADGRPRHRDGR